MSDRAKGLSQAKSLGLAGAILLLVSWIPMGGVIFAAVGSILVLIAVKRIAKATEDSAIYTNMLYSIASAIIGVVVLTMFIFAGMFSLFAALDPVFDPAAFSEFPDMSEFPSLIAPFFMWIIIGLILIWILYLLSAIFLRRSFQSISARLGVGSFNTASLLYLIGAVLTIVLVGFILIFIAEVYMVMAFASIDEQQTSPQRGS